MYDKYLVKEGESIESISQNLNIDPNMLKGLNNIYDDEYLLNTNEKVIERQNIEKSNQVKSIRNQYMSDTLARCDRYEKQKAIGLDTTESEDTYRSYLLYLQYLRDVPQQLEFPNIEVLTFDKWSVTLIEKINTSEES